MVSVMIRLLPGSEIPLLAIQMTERHELENQRLFDALVRIDPGLDVELLKESLNLLPEIQDHSSYLSHIVTKAKFFARYDIEGNYFGHYKIEGHRIKKGTTTEILIQIAASEPITYETLKFRAGGSTKDDKYLANPIQDVLGRLKTICIFPSPPIESGKKLKYWYEFQWPNVGNDPVSSDHINLKSFSPLPIDDVRHELTFPYKLPELPYLFEYVGGDLVRSALKVKEKREGKNYIYEYRSKGKNIDSFLIFWRRPTDI